MLIFSRGGICRKIRKKNNFYSGNLPPTPENFGLLKIKGYGKTVVGYSYNILALKQVLGWGTPIDGMKFLQQALQKALLYLGLWFRVYIGSSISLFGQ